MVIDIQNWQPSEGDKLILDTNIWLYLHCAIGNYHSNIVAQYSTLYRDIVNSKTPVFVPAMVLSEFINVYLKMDFNAYKNQGKFQKYKRDYRPSPEYKVTFATVKSIVKNKIVAKSNRLNDDFETVSIDDIMDAAEEVDYNDSYYAELAKNGDYKIVTNDADFSYFANQTDILTSNPRLIAAGGVNSGGTT